nr:hypothetical protein CFP56_10548 [Quercus suber]
MMKHHSQVVDFANLDFEAIDTEILVGEIKEKKDGTVTQAADVFEGDGIVVARVIDKPFMDVGRVEEVVNAP